MRTLLSSWALLALAVAATPARAQRLELPAPSPAAKVAQTVGLTELGVDYSSPRVNGRKIWGGLLPYGQVWRAGANAATKLTVSKEVTINGTKVPAGTYSLFVIPQKTGPWTVIINKDAQANQGSYTKDQDVVRADIKPQPIALRERLQYSFGDFANQNGVSLELEWEKVRLSVPIKVGTDAQVAANIKAFDDNRGAPYTQAARYMLEQKKDYDAGIELVDKSIAIKEEWLNVWTKAQLLAAKGSFKQALAMAQKADDLGEKVVPADRYFFKDEVKKALAEWKAK